MLFPHGTNTTYCPSKGTKWLSIIAASSLLVLLCFLVLKLCAIRTEDTASLAEPAVGRGR